MELFVAGRCQSGRRRHSQSSRRAPFTTRDNDMNSQALATLAVPVNANDHVRGSKNASFTLVEYGDYECPYCGQAHYVVQPLEDVAAGTVSSISDVVSLSAWPTTVVNLK